MKVVVAFDSFKGCISAEEACHTAAVTLRQIIPNATIIECPLSDGGEGLIDCVEQLLPVERITIKAHTPLMNIINASYIIDKDTQTAYMEMAATSGLPLVPKNKRNPMITTTYGVGEMIIDATQRGYSKIVLGIGGSATCDGGKGMVQCLKEHGYLDAQGKMINSTLGKCTFTIASDVTNPLYGKQGAAYIFAPQKGATHEQVVLLDIILRNWARETEKAGWGFRQAQGKPINLADWPGAGAAGGLGYGLMAYLKADMKSGIDIILDLKNFDDLIEGADCIITGEGKSDEQTLMGKVPHGVLKRAQKHNIPVWLLSGCIEDKNHLLSQNFKLIKSINEGDIRPLEILMQATTAKENIQKTIQRIFQ